MLENKNCVPCQGGIPPLNKKQIESFQEHIDKDWVVNLDKELEKSYEFKKYTEAIQFVNSIADLAENQGHHPFIHINYKKVVVIVFSHKIGGLHENDFLMAQKIDHLYPLS